MLKQEIIATFARRLHNHPDFERAEAIRNIHRIAEIRLNDKFGYAPTRLQLISYTGFGLKKTNSLKPSCPSKTKSAI
ncbi:2-oxo-4-hydroxy-4-carboxy-5-ureidoimidazoline decarboxylase [Campylobacter hyointestinalis]|uniref:2-oxo-4-hydroxy-4-carboxy-5-ureidoimidazoline decarboxylase n=1 Tax=Campylobacter hyointestinalis TaxID=198 RepID=UPI00358DEC78